MLKINDNVDLKELEKFGYSQKGLPMFNDYFKNLDNNIFTNYKRIALIT